MSPRRAKAVRGRVGDDPATALREHLIDSAEKLLAERQVSAITTRDIARAAGVSDGVLYNYFADKNELLVAAMVRRYAVLVSRFDHDLPEPGTATVEENLAVFGLAALDVVAQTLPTAAGLLSEPALLHRFIDEIHRQPFGPQRMRQPIADYLAGEQRLGRLAPDVDTEAVIALIMGPAFMLGLGEHIAGAPREFTSARIPAIIRTLVRGLGPAR
jgi:AcrR family transcriptional regulator